MKRDEFVRMLAAEPATPNQVGAIRGEFRRLGLDGDRSARLAAAAALLGLDSLSSSTDLTMGQAGHLVKTLRSLTGAGQLAAAVRQARIRTIRSREVSMLAELAAVVPACQQMMTALWGPENRAKRLKPTRGAI